MRLMCMSEHVSKSSKSSHELSNTEPTWELGSWTSNLKKKMNIFIISKNMYVYMDVRKLGQKSLNIFQISPDANTL